MSKVFKLTAVPVLLLLLAAASAIGLAACGGSGTVEAKTQTLGATTNRADVVAALEGTGYDLRFRQVPRVEGWEIVAGQASRGSEAVQFAVEIRRAGPIEKAAGDELNQQPPILRYAFREEGTAVGNVVYRTQVQAPKQAGGGVELEVDKAETQMAVEVGIALRRLFANRYRPEG